MQAKRSNKGLYLWDSFQSLVTVKEGKNQYPTPRGLSHLSCSLALKGAKMQVGQAPHQEKELVEITQTSGC